MKAWWQNLNERERWVLGIGTGLLCLILFYSLIWHPFRSELQRLRQTVAGLHTELAWMHQAAQELKRAANTHDRQAPLSRTDNAPPLLTLVDQTARSIGLGKAIKRIEPQDEGQVRIRLEQADFDRVIRWLNTLQKDHGIRTFNAIVERHQQAGRVNVRLILQGNEV